MSEPALPIERKLAAIFAADVVGYSRLMGQDEVGTLRRLASHRQIMDRLIAEHRGRIANTAGGFSERLVMPVKVKPGMRR
jgi:adenylate cyclase